MVCQGEDFLKCKLAKNCKCYRAVMQAYRNMVKDDDVPDSVAVEAAQRVYGFHRPEEDISVAHVTVERWINQGHIQ